MGLSQIRKAATILCATTTLFAQGTTSRVIGVVEDSSGASVANANVTLTSEGTGVSFKAQTSVSGAYAFEAIQSGSYSLGVEAPGFRKFSSKNNVVTIGQPATINVRQYLGGIKVSIRTIFRPIMRWKRASRKLSPRA